MSSSRKIFKGIFWSLLYNICNAFYGFIAVPVLIKYFGRSEYGLISLALSINAYVQIMDMGLGSTNVRFFSIWLAKDDKEKVNKLFSTSNLFYTIVGIINVIVLLVMFIFSDSIFSLTYTQAQTLKKLLLILMAASLINWSTSCFNQMISASENVDWVQKCNILTKLLMVVALILTLMLNLSLVTYFFLSILATWIILPIVILKVRRLTPFVSFKLTFDKDTFREILPYSLNMFSFTFFSVSFLNLRTLFLGIQGQVENVTDYAVMTGIVGIISSLCGVFMSSILPSASKTITTNNASAYCKIAYNGTKYITLFVSFCVFGMLSISRELLFIYVGNEFMHLLPWLMLYILTMLSNNILAISSLIMGSDDIRPLSRMTAVSCLCGVICAWVLIPYFGAGGAVLSLVVYNVFQQLYYYFYYWPKLLNINSRKIFVKYTLPIYGISASIYFITTLIPLMDNCWFLLFIKGGLFLVLFFIFFFLYSSDDDKHFFKLILKNNSHETDNNFY